MLVCGSILHYQRCTHFSFVCIEMLLTYISSVFHYDRCQKKLCFKFMCAWYANIMFRSKWSLKLAKMTFSFISIHFTAEIRSKMNNCVIQLAFRMDDSLKLNIYFDWNVSSCHCMVSLPNCRFHLKSFQPVECETIFDLVI